MLRVLLFAPLAGLGAYLLAHCSGSAPPPETTLPPPPPRAELVLWGGVIETMDPAAGSSAKPSAIALKDGLVVAIGNDEDMRPWIGADTRTVELKGGVVLPGLVDSHMHLQSLGMRRFGVDLVGTNSVEEVRERVKKAVKDAKKGDWIQGRGWDQNDWEAYKKKGIKFPSSKDLDDISPDNPVILERIDGHAIWVNKKAMELAGINAKSKSKPGGEIVKGKDGKASGIFIDNAAALIAASVPPPSKEQIRTAILQGQKECLAAGLTQVHDMGIDRATLEVLQALEASGELRLRVYGMLAGRSPELDAMMGAGPLIPKDPAKRLTVRGVKFFADGALGSRGALLLEPYNDDKKASPEPTMPPAELEARVRSATEHGYQVATHAIGDKANRMVLDIYARVFGEKAKALRPRIEHAQILDPSDIPRFAKQGVIASMQPTHATSDMPWAEARLGKNRLKGAYAWRSLLTTGATIAAGSDAPVEDVSPVLGLYAAVSRRDLIGSPAGGWQPQEKMTPYQAMRSFTAGGAIASFREQEAGKIAKGLVADLTVLDKDPLTAPEDDVNAMLAMLTVIGGKIEFEREKPAGAASGGSVTSTTAK